jgi:peptide/nickel transport system substrate-binding protein
MTVYRRLMGLSQDSVGLDSSNSATHTITVSDNGLMYTVYLREGLNFTDGHPLDSKAVLFSLDRLMATKTGKTFFPRLKRLEILTPTSFRLYLDSPWPPFMASLALPQASIISPGLSGMPQGFLDSHSLGSGRFMVESLSPEMLGLKIRPDLPSRPALDRVEFYYAEDPTERFKIFTQKEAHLLSMPTGAAEIPASWAELLSPQRAQEVVAVEVPSYRTRYLAFNSQSSYLRLKEAREALALLAHLAFSQEPLRPRGLFPLGFLPSQGGFGLKAREGSAGMEGYETKVRELIYRTGPPRVPLVLAYRTDDPKGYADASLLAGRMGEFGFPVKLAPMTGSSGRGILEEGNYDMLLGLRGPDIPSPEMWLGRFLNSRSNAVSNPARFQSREADNMIEGFSVPARPQEREDRVKRLAELALGYLPYVLLYQETNFYLADKRLSDITPPHPMWPEAWPLDQANLDPFRRQRREPVKNTPAPEELMDFDEPVAEPWE